MERVFFGARLKQERRLGGSGNGAFGYHTRLAESVETLGAGPGRGLADPSVPKAFGLLGSSGDPAVRLRAYGMDQGGGWLFQLHAQVQGNAQEGCRVRWRCFGGVGFGLRRSGLLDKPVRAGEKSGSRGGE